MAFPEPDWLDAYSDKSWPSDAVPYDERLSAMSRRELAAAGLRRRPH